VERIIKRTKKYSIECKGLVLICAADRAGEGEFRHRSLLAGWPHHEVEFYLRREQFGGSKSLAVHFPIARK
jgi:hypothetical protein